MADIYLNYEDDDIYCTPGQRIQWIFPVIECRATRNLRDIVNTFRQERITFTLLLGDFIASLLMTEWDCFYDDRSGKQNAHPEDRMSAVLVDVLSDGMYNHVVHELGMDGDDDDDDDVLDAHIQSYTEALYMEMDTIHSQLLPVYAPYVRKYLDRADAMRVSKITGIDIIGDALFVMGVLR